MRRQHIKPTHPWLARGLRCACFLPLFVCTPPITYAAEPAALTPEQLAPIKHTLDKFIRAEMKSKDVAGLSIALVEDQKIVWAEGYGYADRARRLPAHAGTLYSVGGLSTLLTATAVLQLAEQGGLDIDQPVKKYLPGFSIHTRFSSAPEITARHLLSHHSGLPAMHFKGMWAAKPEPIAAFVVRLKDEYAAYPPAHVFSPSLPGYDVLGRVLEIHCKQPFAACMQERLLAPLGMKYSTFNYETFRLLQDGARRSC